MIPSAKVSGTVVQPYYAVLSFHQLVEIGTHACFWTARACTTSCQAEAIGSTEVVFV